MATNYGGQVSGFNPTPGAQRPEKYPRTGAAYAHYGEPPPGWVYSPRDDRYYRDQASRDELTRYEEASGLKEKAPSQPGLTDTILPVAGAAGALYLGKTLATEGFQWGKEALQGLNAPSAGAEAVSQGAQNLGLLGAPGQAGADAIAGTALPQAAPTIANAQALGSGASEVATQAANPGLLSGVSSMPVLPMAAIAASTYLGGKSAYDLLRGKSDNSTQGKIGRGLLGVATGGISELARPFLMHKSTRERQKDVTNELMQEAGDDALAQQYVQGMREQFNGAPPDPSKPFAGKYGSFDEYQQAGLEANDLTGVEGNMQAFGVKPWANLSQEQRVKATQALIDAGQYYSKDGGVRVKDATEAKKIIDAALAQPQPLQKITSNTPVIAQPRGGQGLLGGSR